MAFLSYLHFFCAVINLLIAALVFTKGPRSAANRSCALLFISFAVWSAALVVVHNPHVSHETANTVMDVSAFGGLTFSSIFLWFVLAFCEMRSILRSKWFYVQLIALPALFLFLQMHSHAIMLHDLTLQSYGWCARLNTQSPWPAVNFVQSNGFALAGLSLLFRHSRKAKDAAKRRQAAILFGSGALALLLGGSVNFISFGSGGSFPFITDMVFMLWALGIAYIMTRYRLFELTPSYAAREIIETISDGLLIVSNEGKISVANPAALGILEASRAGILDRPANRFFPEAGIGLAPAPLSVMTAGMETVCLTAAGTEKPVLFSGSILYDGSGEKRGMVCTFQDISQRKRAEKEKDELESRLRQAHKMEAIGQLASGIAHDFNNMLCAVSGYAEMLKRRFSREQPGMDKYVQGILGTSKAMADLIAQLLAFARKGRYTMGAVNLNAVLRDVVQIISHTFDKKIIIIDRLEAGNTIVIGDGAQLQNALLNLAVNARDAMPEGGTLTLSTDVCRIAESEAKFYSFAVAPGHYLRISIADTGVGMDETVKARIFEPFFTTKAQGKGTGLGLASVYGTVKSHNGHIEVKSEPGKGALFQVYLPLVDVAPQAETPAQPVVKKSAGSVLLVDDEERVRDIVSEMLEEMGYAVHSCRDGAEAVVHYRARHQEIHLVLLDLVMPKMDGSECFRELKRINPAVRAVLISGYAKDEVVNQMIAEGALGFLQKPFNMASLSQTVKGMMGARAA